jgi:hypothetical protein
MAMRTYIVRPGDYLLKLAFIHDFDAEEVWNDPKNEELKKLRKNHHILAPGDILRFPDTPKEGLPLQAGVTNHYVVEVPKVDVRLVVKDEAGAPIGGEAYTVEGLAPVMEGTTTPDGAVSFSAPVHLREASLLFPQRNMRLTVRIGDLDPLEEGSGVVGRLANLGFLDLAAIPVSDSQLAAALTAFQRAHGIPQTGTLDDDTRRALGDAHGS